MKRHPTQREGTGRPAPGREGVRTLLRRPGVQLLLCGVAAMQVAAVQGAQRGDEAAGLAILNPVVVTSAAGNPVTALWSEQVLRRESARLAARYEAEGYNVPDDLARTISEAAVENGIDPEIAFGLVRAESSFRNSSTSTVGAVGLTQLMPATARWMEPGVTRRELRDPETNVRIGFKYLKYLMDKYEGDERLALTAYNRGPGTVDRALKRGRDPDNGYADFVFGKEDHGHTLFTD